MEWNVPIIMSLEPPEPDRVAFLLGYREGRSEDAVRKELTETVQEVWDEFRNCMTPMAVCCKSAICATPNHSIILDNGIVFQDDAAIERLKGCRLAVSTVVTLGKGVDDYIHEQFHMNDPIRAMVADIIGNLAIEQLNRKVRALVMKEVVRNGEGVTAPLFPGSNGLPLTAQECLFRIADCSAIGVSLNKSMLMTPMKSTSSLYGIGRGIPIDLPDHQCSECGLVRCQYREPSEAEKSATSDHDSVTLTLIDANRGYVKLTAKKGDVLLNILRKEDIRVSAICGGSGTCGKCKVKVLSGDSEPTEWERRHIKEIEPNSGLRLSCKMHLQSDSIISLPDSMEDIYSITDSTVPAPITGVNAYMKSWYTELPKPHINDQRDDWTRLKEALDMPGLQAELSVLRELPDKLRESDFRVTATTGMGKLWKVCTGYAAAPRYGIAFDLGTTTIAGYLLELTSGITIDVLGENNNQRSFGADVISRIQFTLEQPGGRERLQRVICEQLDRMVLQLEERNRVEALRIDHITIAGNTVMQHLFLGLDCGPLANAPFTPILTEAVHLKAEDFGFHVSGALTVLPAISAYVGGDIMAGIWATGLYFSDKPELLLDIGTNGEIAIGCKDGIYTCAAAAGPAFEGAQIRCGTGGVPGAICRVDLTLRPSYETIQGKTPVGICGSGVLDITHQLILHDLVDSTGLLSDPEAASRKGYMITKEAVRGGAMFHLPDIPNDRNPIVFTQKDIREVQLAKAAIRAGIELLLRHAGIKAEEIARVHVAGGFGSAMNMDSAFGIGLFPEAFRGKIVSVGNTSGAGAKAVLLSENVLLEMEDIRSVVLYVELSTDPDFQDAFVNALSFGEL